MDGMPYYYQVPRRDWHYAASPWERNNVMRSPYEAEEVDPMTEPCSPYYHGLRRPCAAEHGRSKQNRQQKLARSQQASQSATSAAPKIVRNIVVTDGRDNYKEQIKQHQVTEEQKQQLQVQPARKPRFENADAAATCIQRRFRGHQVRKMKPHLRVIKEVRDALKDFQERACNPEFLRKLKDDKMERLRFDEGIMKEVLKLDSLQGVQPLVRDLRKATARGLVRLQDVTEEALSSGRLITPDDLTFLDIPVDTPMDIPVDGEAEGDIDMAVDASVSDKDVPMDHHHVSDSSEGGVSPAYDVRVPVEQQSHQNGWTSHL